MASDRIQRRIERLLDQIEQEVEQEADLQNWQRVCELAGEALEFAPGNADATTFLEVAERRLAAAAAEPQFPNPSSQVEATPQPTSFASGRYDVKRFLGEGGKKRVYLAQDTLLDREVAFALIKIEGLDEVSRTRITREAQAMGRLGSQPHIVTVFDLGEHEGQPYMVTELMDGGCWRGMDLIIKALTEPQPFSWEGRYYQFRTVSVWPRPVQQPHPPVIVATRSEDTIQYAAQHHLGLGVSFIPVAQMAQITEKYRGWCEESGWQPRSDQVVYRGSIYLAETDRQAEEWFGNVQRAGLKPAIPLRPVVAQAIQAARAGEEFDLRNVLAGSAQGDVGGLARGLSFMGGPDTIVKQLKAFHDQCGAGVVDLFFQQPALEHRDVMKEIELFGQEVLPRIKEF